MCGHKTLVCAVSNNVVDKAANSCWEKSPKNQRKKYKFLRYETASAEMKAYTTRMDIANPAASDPDARPAYKKEPKAEDDDVVREAKSQAATLQGDHAKQIAELWQVHRDYARAVREKYELDSRKEANVPSAMTLGTRAFDLTMDDEVNAQAEYSAERDALLADKLDAAAIQRLRDQDKIRSEAQAQALGQDKISEAEFEARVRDGRFRSVQQRDVSWQYYI